MRKRVCLKIGRNTSLFLTHQSPIDFYNLSYVKDRMVQIPKYLHIVLSFSLTQWFPNVKGYKVPEWCVLYIKPDILFFMDDLK